MIPPPATKKTKIMLVSDKNMLYLCCQTNYLLPSVGGGNDRKFAFVKGAARKRPAWLVVRPDNPKTEAFFVKLTMHKSDSCGDAIGKATQTIHTISEVDSVLNKAREAVLTSSPYVRQELSENIQDTMLALGLALYEQLSTIYEEEAV